jgi:eukaryotic-like serine/threonine-protein kinase
MIDETLPPGKRKSDSRSSVRGVNTQLPPVDQTSETLHGFGQQTPPPPLAPTLPPPPALPPSAAPPDETHPKKGDATIAPSPPTDGRTMVPKEPAPVDGRTMVPNDAAPVLAKPAPGTAPTVDAARAEVTLGGQDPQTQEYQKAALAATPKAITTGASFGHYELIEPIAKGGMGIVYKARQRNLNRVVAIKMILAGQFADQADIDRFYAEAEAAAALNHPNIVAIHEIGEVQGQHFFSMDYIDGQSLSALVHENPLRPRRAAELMRTIAETMQFAHESGVVHRDLKPANVLLDKRQRPLITDFGLAKQISGAQSQLTMAGSIVGTPSYMPPEQAAGKLDEVGPWSDLYSLGAILYELLTGRPPFRSASPFETIRQVLETEPLSPRLLNENVPKDLETICLKCLQKERSRRYASAQELADELGRFLRGEPIQARPISQVARFWRLCKRNPITASAIALAVAILFAATGISTGFYVQASRALVKSDESLKEAIAAVNEMFTTVSEDTLLNEPGMQPLREKMLTKAKSYFERFLTQRAGDPKVEVELAGAYFRLGKIAALLQSADDALKPYQKAREMQERLLAKRPNDLERLAVLGETVNALGEVRVTQDELDAAKREYGEAVRLRERLVAADPSNSGYQRSLANTHMNVGTLHASIGDYAEARQEFDKAQQIREATLQAAPANDLLRPKLRRDLGRGFFSLGRLDLAEGSDGAEDHFKSAANTFETLATEDPLDLENQKPLALSNRMVGDVLLSKANFDEARQWYQRAISRAEPLAQQNPKVVGYSTEWAAVLLSLFSLESQSGNTAAARTALERARDILAPLAKRFPTAADCQRDLAVTLRELAIVKYKAGDRDAAKKDLNESLQILETLAKQYSKEPSYEQLQATTLRKLAVVEQDAGDNKVAAEHLIDAAGIMRRLVARFATEPVFQFELATTLRELASLQVSTGDAKLASDNLGEAIRILTDLVKQFPDDAEFKEQLEAAKKATAAATSP